VSGLPRRRVAVVDEHEIFRLGLVAALENEPRLVVVHSAPAGPVPRDVDVVVVSLRALERDRFRGPVVVCTDTPPRRDRRGPRNRIAAVLPRSSLTLEQLVATVGAVGAGLRVNQNGPPTNSYLHGQVSLDTRGREVLRLLAEGQDTAMIAEHLCYSVRTIKSLIQDIERELCATSRAQAVAHGIRQGLI
jgi:DNA-binding NarL/FixJ family response regulator